MKRSLDQFMNIFQLKQPRNFLEQIYLQVLNIRESLKESQNKEVFEIQKIDLKNIQIHNNLQITDNKEVQKILQQKNIQRDQSLAHSLMNIEFNAVFAYSYILHNFFNHEYLQIKELKNIVQIICEEYEHFCLLQNYCKKSDLKFGDLPVTQNIYKDLTQMNTLIENITMISLCHEGRGMHAGPKIANKLKNQNFIELSQIVEKIANDEKNHVNFGLNLLKKYCLQNQICPQQYFDEFQLKHIAPSQQINLKIII